MREFFWKLTDIVKDAYIQDAQESKFFIDGIKAKNSEMKIDNVSVMNDKATWRISIDFNKAFSYLKTVWPLPEPPTLIYLILHIYGDVNRSTVKWDCIA